jgi:hypothetical protein
VDDVRAGSARSSDRLEPASGHEKPGCPGSCTAHGYRRHDLDFTGVETELERLKAAVSTGYARGKLFEVAKTPPRDRGDWYD